MRVDGNILNQRPQSCKDFKYSPDSTLNEINNDINYRVNLNFCKTQGSCSLVGKAAFTKFPQK